MRRKLSAFDRASAVRIRDDLAVALARIGGEIGVELKVASVRYDKCELTIRVVGRSLAAEARDRHSIVSLAALHGLDVDKIGPDGERLVDFNRRARSHPWVFERRNGSRDVCDGRTARAWFGIDEEVGQ